MAKTLDKKLEHILKDGIDGFGKNDGQVVEVTPKKGYMFDLLNSLNQGDSYTSQEGTTLVILTKDPSIIHIGLYKDNKNG